MIKWEVGQEDKDALSRWEQRMESCGAAARGVQAGAGRMKVAVVDMLSICPPTPLHPTQRKCSTSTAEPPFRPALRIPSPPRAQPRPPAAPPLLAPFKFPHAIEQEASLCQC